MRETIEFRIPEELAERYLPRSYGQTLGGDVRKVELTPDDPVLREIQRIDRELRDSGRGAFVTYWHVRRRYSRSELEEGEVFHAFARKVFEPAGEECGTIYDDSQACPVCGAGAVQTTPLFLDGRRIPRKSEIAETIASEIVVSRHVVDLFTEKGLRGADFDTVRLSNWGGDVSSEHFQLKFVGQPVELHTSTRAGGNFLDRSEYGRCSRGHVVGLNLLSEVTVRRGSLTGADIMVTRQMVGVRRGLLRPRPIMLLSPKAWRAMESRGLKDLRIEVAHLS